MRSDVVSLWLWCFPAGEATLTDALTAAGKTYEEIAQMVAEQVRRESQHRGRGQTPALRMTLRVISAGFYQDVSICSWVFFFFYILIDAFVYLTIFISYHVLGYGF